MRCLPSQPFTIRANRAIQTIQPDRRQQRATVMYLGALPARPPAPGRGWIALENRLRTDVLPALGADKAQPTDTVD
jgi:hypothetical protein